MWVDNITHIVSGGMVVLLFWILFGAGIYDRIRRRRGGTGT